MTNVKRRKQRANEKPLPAPTSAEMKGIALAKAAQADRPARARLTLKEPKPGAVGVSNPHSDGSGWYATVQETFGTTSMEFVNDCVVKLSLAVNHCDGQKGQDGVNASLALIAGIGPQNEAEAAIAVQIAIAHAASIHLTGRGLLNAKEGHRDAAVAYIGMGTKASRTMLAAVEALARLRGGGRQIVEHRYINVNAANAVVGDHTQAVFGAINAPGGANQESDLRPHEPASLAYAPLAPMPGAQPPREAVSGSGDAGKETVPTPRRQVSRRSQGQG